MVRRRGWVRLVGSGFRRVAVLGVAFALIAPACGGRSVSIDEGGDEPTPPGNDDVDDDDIVGDDVGFGGGGGTTPTPQGGVGAVGNTGGVIVTGGAFPMGGAVPTGGTVPTGGVTATGGRPPTGGAAGIPGNGGTIPIAGAGSGGVDGRNADPECKGILNNMACRPEGKLCENLVCGLADAGRRMCACATNWACTTCDHSNSPFRDRPAVIPACPPEAADEASCTQSNTVCGPVGGYEYCACYTDPTDGLIWDCDSPPSSWN